MLQLKQYVPIIKSGIAEVGAFRSLYPSVKDVVFPVFLMRPWPNAGHLKFSIDKLVDAVGDRSFGLALDRGRYANQNTRKAQSEFDALFNERLGYRAYYDMVASIPNAVPVLQPTRSASNLLLQIGNADDLDRGVIVHQRRGSEVPLSDMIVGIAPMPHDSVIIVDAGWSRDYNALEAFTLPIVERVLRSLPNAEIVIASSSFPDKFDHIVGNSEEEGTERRLFSVLRQRHNEADLTYGDWASTRPQQEGGGGNRIPSRVDIPKSSSWEIFRADPKNDLGFPEMAWKAQHHDCFGTVPDCWGKETIIVTNDEGVGVTSPRVAAEVRINIHMTIQSEASSIAPSDEIPYED